MLCGNECRRRATLLANTHTHTHTHTPLTLGSMERSTHTHSRRLVHIRAMSHERIDASYMAVPSCSVRRRRTTLLAATRMAHSQDIGPTHHERTHLFRLVHIGAMPCQSLDTVDVALLSSNPRWRCAIQLCHHTSHRETWLQLAMKGDRLTRDASFTSAPCRTSASMQST